MSRNDSNGTAKPPELMSFSQAGGSVQKDYPLVIVLFLFVKQLVTFIGVFVHELAHDIAVVCCGLEIHEISHLRIKEMVRWSSDAVFGFVRFQRPLTYWQSFFIFTAPAYFNHLVAGVMFLWLAGRGVSVTSVVGASVVELVVLWVAVSVTVHALPSMRDIENVGTYDYGDEAVHTLHESLAAPLLHVYKAGAHLSIYGFDVVWALAYGVLLAALV